jgi:hypothetical protein
MFVGCGAKLTLTIADNWREATVISTLFHQENQSLGAAATRNSNACLILATPTSSPITPRMVTDYCRKRVAVVLSPLETQAMCRYLIKSLKKGIRPPRITIGAWSRVSAETGISTARLTTAQRELCPIFDAVSRSIPSNRASARKTLPQNTKSRAPVRQYALPTHARAIPEKLRCFEAFKPANAPHAAPLWTEWHEPATFAQALQLHIERHGETSTALHREITRAGYTLDLRAFARWSTGARVPRSVQSMHILRWIEHRYRLQPNYFKDKIPNPARAARGHLVEALSAAERRRLAWHLPDDFNSRTRTEQETILAWINQIIIAGSTDYRAFQAAAIKTRYSVRFRSIQALGRRPKGATTQPSTELVSSVIDAPDALESEMLDLLRFKTSTLTEFGFQRNGVWNEETASQKVEHLGLLFGAFVASPRSTVSGFGARLSSLCFAMLAFPATWDWYLQWRERRRGFYTRWELDMLGVALALVRKETGWLRQNPSLVNRLEPIPGLISENDIAAARADWDGACDAMTVHGRSRIKEITRVVRVHRDPFEPILPILEAESPVGEYRKITDEIARLTPDESRHPRAAAEMVRSFLMLRFGLHLGLRQRNLRELRVCFRGQAPTSERQLEDMKRGELRWSDKDNGWEVFIPSIAFKNSSSSFFGSKPFRLMLPDLGGLYEKINGYLDRHRVRLIGPADDPGTFFVKTAKKSSVDAAYDRNAFYEAWRSAIQRHGIYNPFTGRGAIKGLLPHGPHNVRDVLATHISKKTGSYEQASYAIQDTPDMVAKHYGRFLPQDKSAIAAQILNRAWDDS